MSEMPVDSMRPGDRFEAVGKVRDGLGPAEKQDTALAQGKIKQQEDLLLRFRTQVNEKVAAGEQVEGRGRGVGQDILGREDHEPAQLGRDAIAAILFRKETGKPL